MKPLSIFRITLLSLCFIFMQALAAQAQSSAEHTTTYTVQQGETLLGIANRHGTTLDHMLKLNPKISPDYVQAGQTIIVPATKAIPYVQKQPQTSTNLVSQQQVGEPQKPQPIITYKEYKVKRKDTAYSLAKANNITVDELMDANPAMREEGYKLKKGIVIRIPVKTYPPEPQYKSLTTINVAIVLPFIGKGIENERSVEFYRGMLMGINDLKQTGINIHVSAYNEPVHDASIAQLMNEITKQKPDVIVGPLYPSHFNDVTTVADKQTNVVVPFSSKVPQVEYRKNVFVINTPANYEATLQIDMLCKSFSKSTHIIILSTLSGTRKTLCSALQKKLIDLHYNVTSLPASSTAEQIRSALKRPTKGDFIIIPDDDSEATLKQLLATASALRSLMNGCNLSIVGYEPWIALSESAYRNQLHAADAYILTPNYYYPYTSAAQTFTTLYERWFKTKLLDCKPHMAPLGYDFSRCYLSSMATYGHDYGTQSPQAGTVASQPKLQTDLRFLSIKSGGYINRSMWLIHFKKDMTIVKLSAL